MTTAPTNVGTTQAEIQCTPCLRESGAARSLGITRPTVAAGDAVYPVLVHSPGCWRAHTRFDRCPETDGTFDCRPHWRPERIQASSMSTAAWTRHVSRTWIRRCGWRLNSGLRKNSTNEVLRGVEGLLTGSKLPNHNNVGRTTHAQYLSAILFMAASMVASPPNKSDRQGADGTGIVRARGEHLSGETARMSALDASDGKDPRSMVSAHMPAVASTKQNNV